MWQSLEEGAGKRCSECAAFTGPPPVDRQPQALAALGEGSTSLTLASAR